MNQEEQGMKMWQVIEKCWADEAFKGKLLADPEGTLKAEGVELPAGLSIRALENTESVFHLVIPAKPTELSADDLDRVVAGSTQVATRAVSGIQQWAVFQQWALWNVKFDY